MSRGWERRGGAIAAIACAWALAGASVARAEPAHIFQGLGPAGASPGSAEARWKAISIDFGLLESEEVGSVVIDLFDGASHEATRERVVMRGEKSYTWYGRVPANPVERVILTVRDGHMAGIIPAPGGPFQVKPMPGGGHRLVQIDQGRFTDGEALPPLSAGDGPAAPGSPEAPADGDGVIWVLVVYTAQAEAASGDIFAEIQLMIDESNQAYENSQVTTRLSLAHAQEVDYVQSGSSSTDLTRLSGTADGYMDEVHALRTRYHADEVVLLASAFEGTICGRAYVMNLVNHSFWNSAFAVVKLSCATGYYSFGHEIGHNMGSEHDRAHADVGPDSPLSPSGAYTYSYGYQHPSGTPANNWRTVMAYNCSPSCPRIQYFSNPDVTYNGDAMGIDPPAADSADNAQSINNADSTVANFLTGSPMGETHYNADETDEIGVFRNGMWYVTYSPDFAPSVDLQRAFGSPVPGSDKPLIGEFDCSGTEGRPDGIADLAVLRSASSTWMASLSSSGWPSAPEIVRTYGSTNHKRIRTRLLDTNGDGCSDIGVYRNGCFAVTESPDYVGTDKAPCLGLASDEPIAGDLTGDGVSDLGLWRPGTATFYFTYSPDFTGNDLTRSFGAPGDIPFLGEFNGDEKLDLGVYRPGTSSFFVTYSPDWGAGADLSRTHGVAGDAPILADVNGDGRTDIGVFRNAVARWYVLCSPGWSAPACLSKSFGTAGDIPIYGKNGELPP